MNNPYQAPSTEEWLQQVAQQQQQLQQQQASSVDFVDITQGKKDLEKLAKLKVNSPDNFKTLVNTYYWAMARNYQNGEPNHQQAFRPQLISLIGVDWAVNPPNPKVEIDKVANVLKLMKKFAVDNGYVELSDAVTQSAYWFWKNIEEPKNPQASLASYGTNESDPAVEKAKKRATRAKFIQWGVIGTSLLIGGTMIYFAFFREPKQAKKSNPRRISSGVGKVTKGRVRKRNRKAPVKAGLPKRNPVIPRTSSLAEYRKKFEQEKRQKARKTNPKRKTTVRKSKGLRLKK